MKYKISDFISGIVYEYGTKEKIKKGLDILTENYKKSNYKLSIKWKHYPNEIEIREGE